MTNAKLSIRPATYFKAALAALAGLALFWACQTNEAGEDKFNITPDSAWANCDRLLVELRDTNGTVLDTLFNDTLKSLSQLNGLDASKYKGGRAVIHVTGTSKGNVCIDQTRSFDDKGGKVIVDTLSLPNAKPASVALSPSTLSLNAGDPGVEVKASISPKFADQLFEWSVDDPSVATLDLPAGADSGKALVIPLKNGTAHIKVKAKADGSKSAELVVQVGSVGGRTITVQPDSLDLFLGGPDSVLKASTAPDAKDGEITWSSSDEAIVKVDDKGKVHGLKEGAATVKAKFGEATASSRVRVKRDVPVLTVASKPGAAVNAPIVFSPKATQEFGSIVMFKFDLNGDSAWDDSLPGPFLGATVDLPPQTASFKKEGTFKVRFLVRDSEGNEAVTVVSVDIGNQPPEIVSKSNDTVISINDIVPLQAKAHDAEGKVKLLGWDYNNDGKLDDSVTANDSTATIKVNHKFTVAGKHDVRLFAVDDAGKTSFDTVRVEVLIDPPVCDMGPDLSVIAGGPVAFSVKGTDKFGTIVKREIKIGSGSFINLGKQDTTIVVPGDTGKVNVVGRVTDDDGNTDEDTMVVTLIPPTKSNNDLASLVPSAGALVPAFKPVTVAYSLSVGYADSMVAVTALTTDPSATLLINGKPATSGKASDSVAIPVGTTLKVFEIVVTAQDGGQKAYTVAVTRAPSADASLSKLEPAGFSLKPAFMPDVFDYADTVAFKVLSATIKPTASHPAAKITVNDSVVATGTASKPVNLDVGDNLIKVSVTAQDGKTKSAYTVKVVRRAKVIVTRSVAGVGALADSLEAPLGAVVSLKAKDTTGFHFTRWSLTEGAGTFADSTVNPASLTVKSATVRATGAFAINVYTITGTVSGFVGGAFDHPTIQIENGKDTTITVTPLVGYRIAQVTDSGVPLSSLGVIANKFGAKQFKLSNVTRNHTLIATFFKTYSLVSSVTGSGTISPSGPMEVDSGSTQAFTMVSGSPSTGVWVSSFTDNGSDALAGLTGDRMNTSTYTLSNITANHTIAATFAIRTFQLTVVGKRVSVCEKGSLCFFNFCLPGKICPPPPDSITTTVNYGVDYNISTDTTGIGPFSTWCGSTALVSNGNPAVVNLTTGDGKYTAKYNGATCLIINCCKLGTCCVIGGPIPVLPQSTSSPSSTAQSQSKEPDPSAF